MIEIENILLERGYKASAAKLLAVSLQKINIKLQPLLENWLENGVEEDIIVNGISLQSIKLKYHLKYPAALLSINWLIKEPEKAKNAISRGIR